MVAGLFRGAVLSQALAQLDVRPEPTYRPLRGVLRQAAHDLKEHGVNPEEAVIAELIIDEGPGLKRRRFRSRGRTSTIVKRRSHIKAIVRSFPKSKRS